MSKQHNGAPRGKRPLNPQDLKNIGKNSKKTIMRLLGLLKPYRARLGLVFLCIVISAGAGILGSMFTRILIDDHITPLTEISKNPVISRFFRLEGGEFTPLLRH
ncbi:MAG: hypothetical protein IJ941_05860 [Clostridia bacterium]|nr:hypothetical protein [Clostridia bacterium]